MNSLIKNFQKKYCISQKNKESSFGFFKWVIKTELTILIIFFIIITMYKLIPQSIIFQMKYSINKHFIYDKNSQEHYNFDSVKSAILRNNSISEHEKNFLNLFLESEIKENVNYIDTKKIESRLENLKVTYNKKYYYDKKEGEYIVSNPKYEMLGIAGKYNAFFNKITIYEQINEYEISKNYNEEKFDFSKCNKEAYFHELNHLLSNNNLNTITNKSNLSEAINELFTREYYYSLANNNDFQDKGYDEYIIFAYSLAELLPENVVRKYKFDNNDSIIIKGLLEIDNNLDEVYKLLSSINSFNIYQRKDKSGYMKFYNSLKYFYEKKYNQDINDNIDLLLYFYGTSLQSNDEKNKLKKYLNLSSSDEIIDIIPKGYYSNNYTQMHEKTIAICKINGQKKIIEIE